MISSEQRRWFSRWRILPVLAFIELTRARKKSIIEIRGRVGAKEKEA